MNYGWEVKKMSSDFIKFYGARNIVDKKMLNDIKKEITSDKVLQLTPTANLKELRAENQFLKEKM